MYRPLAQTFMFPMAFVVRTSGPPAQVAAAVRQAAFEIDPVVPVAELQPYTTVIAETLGRPRLLELFALDLCGSRLAPRSGRRLRRGRLPRSPARARDRHSSGARRGALENVAERTEPATRSCGLVWLAIGLPAAFVLSRGDVQRRLCVTTRDPLTFRRISPIGILVIYDLAARHGAPDGFPVFDPVRCASESMHHIICAEAFHLLCRLFSLSCLLRWP